MHPQFIHAPMTITDFVAWNILKIPKFFTMNKCYLTQNIPAEQKTPLPHGEFSTIRQDSVAGWIDCIVGTQRMFDVVDGLPPRCVPTRIAFQASMFLMRLMINASTPENTADITSPLAPLAR